MRWALRASYSKEGCGVGAPHLHWKLTGDASSVGRAIVLIIIITVPIFLGLIAYTRKYP